MDKFDGLITQCVEWASAHFQIGAERIDAWLHDLRTEMMHAGKAAIGQTLVYTGNLLIILILIPVYIFMLLYYQPLLIEFIHRLFRSNRKNDVDEILASTKKIIRSYLGGLLTEASIIATLYSTSLLIVGIDYAILLGVIGAILNVVPYIGGTMAVSLPFVIALTTKPSASYAFLVLGIYIVIQFADNHFIVPKVVASKVKINALVSVIVVIAGSSLWGIPGMLVSIPLTAIIKVLCDHIEALKPWGFLLGDTMPPILTPKFFFRKKVRTKAVH
jgi:predicted PurR-regulated permease PerM